MKNLLQPVRFSDAVEGILTQFDDEKHRATKVPNIVVEIGPHAALKNPVKQTIDMIRQRSEQRPAQVTYLASLVRGDDSEESLLGLASTLFTMGSTVDLAAVNQTSLENAKVISDLPAYEWDRSSRFIIKSRIAQNKLFPKQPYDPLLGWKSPYTEGGEHTFRQVFTLDELPWIRDHNVAGTVVFPMTGYLSMAIEAFRRIPSKPPPSILVKEFHASRSLEIEEDEKVDITTKLRPAATGTETYSANSWDFEVLTWTENSGWIRHVHGQIEADPNDVSLSSPTLNISYPLINHKDIRETSAEDEYEIQRQLGTRYGPAFQTMEKFWEGRDDLEFTVAEARLRDLDLSKDASYGSPVSTDPPTLDVFLQGIGPFEEIDGKRPAHMPNYVSRIRVSNNIPADPNLRIIFVTRKLNHDIKAGKINISVAGFARVADKEELIPIIEWECVTFRLIGSMDSGDSEGAALPSTYYWSQIPNLDHADDDKLAEIVGVEPIAEHELERRRRLNDGAVYYMSKALRETENDDKSQQASHLAAFAHWAKNVVSRRNAENMELSGEFLETLRNSDGQGDMLVAIGEQLVPILREQVKPLEVMLKDDRLPKHYAADLGSARGSRAIARCVRHLSDVKPNLRILEIGAGTGSATQPTLQALTDEDGKLVPFESYTFTDISTGFFEKARENLSKWSERITYKRLDISQDPTKQNFDLETYDLVIASNVLHATTNMVDTIDNVRSLLKPNGKLLLLEAVYHPALALPFALLPGWWLSEDEYRDIKEGPLLSVEMWQKLLSERGFSGVDGAVADYPGTEEQLLTMMTSTRIGQVDEEAELEPITICGPLLDDEEGEFAQTIAETLGEEIGCETTVKPFAELDVSEDSLCVFVDTPGQGNSIFNSLSDESFEALRALFLECKALLWIVPEDHGPEAEMIRGMLRTLRLETDSKALFLLENIPYSSEGGIAAVMKVAKRLRDPEFAKQLDKDLVWKDDMIQSRRFRQVNEAKEVYAHEAGIPMRKTQNIWSMDDALELTVEAAGSPDAIYFRRTNVLKEFVGENEVLIKNEAAGINFRDLLLVLGSIPWTAPGFEGAGVVVQKGSAVDDLKEGDRVFYGALGGGSFSTYMKMPSARAVKIPDGLSSADAAGIFVAYSTAVMAVMRIGRLRKGETILIHAASGAVGQACIVLAQHIGAKIFATAGNNAKREFLTKEYGIPQNHIFSSRTPEFRDGVMCATNGRGVDLAVNSLSGNLLQETWNLMADFGRFIEIGKKDALANSHLGMRPFDRNVTFSGVDLRKYFDQRPDELQECIMDVVNLIEQGVIHPVKPVTTLPISQLATGLRKLQGGQNIGKIVVTLGPDEKVLAELPPPLESSGQLLTSPATYLITGGTGGIGLSLATWMIDNGAKNVVLLGRSGNSRPEVKKVLDRYKDKEGINLRAVACDVGYREQLEHALGEIKDLPPVRGVIHGALYLRVSSPCRPFTILPCHKLTTISLGCSITKLILRGLAKHYTTTH